MACEGNACVIDDALVQRRGNEAREMPAQAAIDGEAQSIEQRLRIRGVGLAASRLHWKAFSDNE